MANALAGYYDVNRNALPSSSEPPDYIKQQIAAGGFDLSKYYWDPMRMALVDRTTGGSLSFDQADPSLGTNVVYPGGASEHFDPSSTPVTSFLNAGSNYADTGGIKSTNDPSLIAQLNADQRTRANQAIVKQVAMGLGASYLANTPWSTGANTLQHATGLASASDAAYGATAGGATGGGGSGLSSVLASGSAATPTLAGSIAGVSGTGAGGAMGLGISDWLNIGNTILGASAANRAANVQAGASGDAIAELRRQFDVNQANQAPYQAAGVGALNQLANPNANFAASPDYAFRRSEGQRDIGNSFAARGGAFSGNALRALDEYNSNLASGEFGNWWNRQAGLAGVGQAANNQVGATGQNTANGVANQLVGAGDARASGIMNSAGIIGQGANNYFGNLLYRRGQSPYVSPQPYGGYSPYVGYGG